MKTSKTFSIILAAFSCLLMVFFSSQAGHVAKYSFQHETESHTQLSAEFVGSNPAIISAIFSLKPVSGTNNLIKLNQDSLWAISQRMEFVFDVGTEDIKYLIKYFIYNHQATLIFPFHNFW